MHTKRRQNNPMGGNGGNGQHRHHNNNRPRRFTNNRSQNEGGGDAASIARTRRNAVQSREKYQMMARDAMSMGDRVLAENYLQHADHYHRVLLSLPPEEIRQPYQPRHDNQQGGEQQAADMQDGAVPVSSSEESTIQPAHESALPSFITQPVVQHANPEEQ